MYELFTEHLLCDRLVVVPAEHSKLGLEAWRRRRLSGRTQVGFHRTELPRSRILHADGQPLHHEILQSRTFSLLISLFVSLLVSLSRSLNSCHQLSRHRRI